MMVLGRGGMIWIWRRIHSTRPLYMLLASTFGNQPMRVQLSRSVAIGWARVRQTISMQISTVVSLVLQGKPFLRGTMGACISPEMGVKHGTILRRGSAILRFIAWRWHNQRTIWARMDIKTMGLCNTMTVRCLPISVATGWIVR